jgi:hypothetical protein
MAAVDKRARQRRRVGSINALPAFVARHFQENYEYGLKEDREKHNGNNGNFPSQ